MVNKKEIKPTRPINIKIMTITLPTEDKSLVSPSDIPHVPNAEVISKRISTIDAFGSVIINSIVATMTIVPARNKTANDLNTSINSISRLKI